VKKQGRRRLKRTHSKRYLATRRRKAERERKLAASRKSLHGRLAHEIVALGNTIITEKIAYRAWQKRFGKRVGLRAPGMFIEMLRHTEALTGGIQGARLHTRHQALAVLPWLRNLRQEALVAALAPLRLWRRTHPTRSLFGVSGGLSRSDRQHSLQEPPVLLGQIRVEAEPERKEPLWL
jgi:hypothetical protein